MLERKKTCETSGEVSLQSSGPLRDFSELQGELSRLETKREGLRPKEFLRWDPAPRRPFDAIKKHAFLASSAGNQVMHPSVFDGHKTIVASLAGNEFMPCSAFT